MSRYKVLASHSNEEVYLGGIELIDQGYSEKPETVKTGELQLCIDTQDRKFWFTDVTGMQVVRNIFPVEETNLNQIRSWQNKQKKKAQA